MEIYEVSLIVPCSDGKPVNAYCLAESEKDAELSYFDCFGVKARKMDIEEVVKLLNKLSD